MAPGRRPHDSIESWAKERLGLGRASLYQYLQVYDWVKERHAEWLRPKPKGFIPELSDATILRSIERQLDGHLAPARRKTFEALRAKALSGTLTREEYRLALGPGRKPKPPLQAFASSLRTLHTGARRLVDLPADVLADLASILARIEALVRTRAELVRIAPELRAELAALGLRDFTTTRV